MSLNTAHPYPSSDIGIVVTKLEQGFEASLEDGTVTAYGVDIIDAIVRLVVIVDKCSYKTALATVEAAGYDVEKLAG